MAETTWDGSPISSEKPRGASIIVWRKRQAGREYLVLHRSHAGGSDFAAEFEGEWAWTPPAGARLPGEPIETTARRELREETGLDVPVTETSAGDEDWAVFVAEVRDEATVILNEEHDRFQWVPVGDAVSRCLPPFVGASILRVVEWLET